MVVVPNSILLMVLCCASGSKPSWTDAFLELARGSTHRVQGGVEGPCVSPKKAWLTLRDTGFKRSGGRVRAVVGRIVCLSIGKVGVCLKNDVRYFKECLSDFVAGRHLRDEEEKRSVLYAEVYVPRCLKYPRRLCKQVAIPQSTQIEKFRCADGRSEW